MSFDVVLLALRDSDERERRLAVVDHLERSGIPVDATGWATFDAADGGETEIDVGTEDAEWCPSFSIYGLSRGVSELVYEMAAVGELAVMPVAEPPVTLVVDVRHQARLPDDDEGRAVVLCPDAAALHEALSGGFADFDEYRRQVLET